MTRSTKILIAVAAIGLSACAFYFLMLAPQRDEVAKLDTDIAGKQAEVAQSQAMIVDLRGGEGQLQDQLRDVGAARQGRPRRRRRPLAARSARGHRRAHRRRLRPRSSSAAASPAPVQATDPTTATSGELASAPGAIPVAGGALSAMPFNFSFSGGFFDLSTFFAKLEHFVTVNNQRIDATGRLLRLESVSITPSAAGFPDMQAAIGAAAYIVPPVEGVPGTAGAPLGRDREREHDAVDPVVAGLDADHDRDRRSSAMNVLTTTWRQLVRRRLWPVAVLLVAALVGRAGAAVA